MFACLWRDFADVEPDEPPAPPVAAAVVVAPVALAPARGRGRGHTAGVTDSAETKLKKRIGQLVRRRRFRWFLEGCYSHVSLTHPIVIGVHGILN